MAIAINAINKLSDMKVLEDEMNKVLEKHGAKINLFGSCNLKGTYAECRTRISLTNIDPKVAEKAQAADEKIANEFFKTWGGEFQVGDHVKMNMGTFRIVGVKPTARKNNVKIENIKTGKIFVTSIYNANSCLIKVKPKSTEIKKGDVVKVWCDDDEVYPATIIRVLKNDKLQVKWDDGATETIERECLV